jgi:hypothetical protein
VLSMPGAGQGDAPLRRLVPLPALWVDYG